VLDNTFCICVAYMILQMCIRCCPKNGFIAIHDVAVELFSQEGLEQQFIFEQRHQKVIEQFGRYPHRNAALGRESTQEEIAFLNNNPNGF